MGATRAGAITMTRRKGGASGREYVFNVKRTRGKAKRIAVKGGATLADFDGEIRKAFGYDTWDHCSGFWEKEAYRSRTIGEIYPDGSGMNEDLPIEAIGLVPGTTMTYVYDFGDDLRHVVTLEDISSPSMLGFEHRL
jgi:hypothetical protein